MKKGICVAGNMILDIIYPSNGWPAEGGLVHIGDDISRATGGAVCNVIMDLAQLDPEMKLYALGRNGADAEGKIIMEALKRFPNIDTSNVICEGVSAFTLVINNELNRQRTFFSCIGANGRFDIEDVEWDKLDCDLLHIGYVLLLNALDKEDAEYGSRMARFLHEAKKRGIKTSIDVVSETGDRFKKLVPPALKYTDYCIINEFEAGQTTGIELRDSQDQLIRENILPALRKMKEMGVSTWAVIHSPEGGFGLDENNRYVEKESLHLPKGYIKGNVGAGDAFCAGVLCGAEEGLRLEDAMILGIGSAAASLSELDSTSGMRTRKEVVELYNRLR